MSNGASNRSFNSDIRPENWDRAFSGEPEPREEREVAPHECEHCGRWMKYADQQCACTAKRAGTP